MRRTIITAIIKLILREAAELGVQARTVLYAALAAVALAAVGLGISDAAGVTDGLLQNIVDYLADIDEVLKELLIETEAIEDGLGAES